MCSSGCFLADLRPRIQPCEGPARGSIIFSMTSKAGEPNETTARTLVAQALRLSESERVRIAAELLESV